MEIAYELKERVSFYIKKQMYEEKEVYYGEKVRMTINVPDEDVESFKKYLVELTDSKVIFH